MLMKTQKERCSPMKIKGRMKNWKALPVLLCFGALGLLGVSGYELWIRLEDFWAWTKGVRHLSATRGTPSWRMPCRGVMLR